MIQTAVKLVAWHPNGSKRSFDLGSDNGVFIGRSSNCGLQLDGADISDIHCRIGLEDGQLWVQNWMSAKPTLLNGEQVTSKTQVGQGAIIEVGPYSIQITQPNVTEQKSSEDDFETVDMAPQFEPEELEEDPFAVEPGDVQPRWQTESAELAFEDQPDDQPESQTVSERVETKLAAAEEVASRSEQVEVQPEENGFDFFADDGLEETYDRATVELLQAEIDDLRTALAARDAEAASEPTKIADGPSDEQAEAPDQVLQRMQELIEEANRADERVMILEEMLHAAEDANRAEVEERSHLEAWVGDIEKRVGQREQEHQAEQDALRQRLSTSEDDIAKLHQKLQQAAADIHSAPAQYEETIEGLQTSNQDLQDQLAEAEKDLRSMQQKLANQVDQTEIALREERAKIAKEHAEVSRMKFEFAQKVKELEEMPTAETDPRLQSLRDHRQHLRQMSEERKQEPTTLSSRLKSLWKRVEEDRT